MRILLLAIFCIILCSQVYAFNIPNPFSKEDYKSQEIKYEHNVLKEDLKYKRDHRILNMHPSGYMTVDEYEKQSEYKDKTKLDYDIPKIDRGADFKYVPQPLYRIVKYNDPPGGVELSLGKKLYSQRQINAQGIVSPDYSKLVYPAVYYYSDTGSVGTDLFVIPLTSDDPPLKKILSANVAKRDKDPIMSTDKLIDNYAAFRSLTPVDFSSDGSKLLVKEKIGSGEDGIWQTNVYVYDFSSKTKYDLSAVREAVNYFWTEYMKLNLVEKMWDIVPLGFDEGSGSVLIKGYAYTGEKPVYLGLWSIDTQGNRSNLVSFEKNYLPKVSSNGYKVIKDGVEEYQTVVQEEKNLIQQDKIREKQIREDEKEKIRDINDDYKYERKYLDAEYKDKYKDNKKLQTFAGSTEGPELEEAYKQYRQEQLQKDIEKTQKKIEKQKKKVDKTEEKIKKETEETKELFKQLYGDTQTQSQNQNQGYNNYQYGNQQDPYQQQYQYPNSQYQNQYYQQNPYPQYSNQGYYTEEDEYDNYSGFGY